MADDAGMIKGKAVWNSQFVANYCSQLLSSASHLSADKLGAVLSENSKMIA
jgi:hypothetical protein